MSNKIKDFLLNILETYSSRLSCWSWNKRWKNRQTGTGYK
jgi:hypothetical protein